MQRVSFCLPPPQAEKVTKRLASNPSVTHSISHVGESIKGFSQSLMVGTKELIEQVCVCVLARVCARMSDRAGVCACARACGEDGTCMCTLHIHFHHGIQRDVRLRDHGKSSRNGIGMAGCDHLRAELK